MRRYLLMALIIGGFCWTMGDGAGKQLMTHIVKVNNITDELQENYMYTVRVNGGWNCYTASRVLVRNGTFAEMIEAMKGMW